MSMYLKSGVDIEAGNNLIEKIKPIAESTARPGVLGGLGAFGALFDLSSIQNKYHKPILVSSTDGVGTKLFVSQATGNHKTIGIDLVAMCVNDILAQGAEPLFFLDYFATGSLNTETTIEVIEGIAEGCRYAGVALIGGETAEMPGFYNISKYDLAGFSVGIVEMSEILPKISTIEEGDLLLGIASNGIHSNGFSLVRKIISDLKINYFDISPWNTISWSEILLNPTKIYVSSVLPIMSLIKGIAHITGGGLIDNIPRALPEHLAAQINSHSWTRHAIFDWLQYEGKLSDIEMYKTFNCGIGMVLIVSKDLCEKVTKSLVANGEAVYVIGKVIDKRRDKIVFV